jgi:thioredoxin-related protein
MYYCSTMIELYNNSITFEVLDVLDDTEKSTKQLALLIAKRAGCIYTNNLHRRVLYTLKKLEKFNKVIHNINLTEQKTAQYVWRRK